MKFIIKSVFEKQAKTGKTYYEIALEGQDGTFYPKATTFEKVTAGQEIDGAIEVNGNYTNFKPTVSSNPKPASGTNIAKAQERKAEYIEKAQDRKNESIAYFNALNSAIALLKDVAPGNLGEEELKANIIYWRDWFLAEWRKYDSQDFTDKHNPF